MSFSIRMTSVPILCKHGDRWHTLRVYTKCKYSCIFTSEGPSINATPSIRVDGFTNSRCFVNSELFCGIATKVCFSLQSLEELTVKLQSKGVKTNF